VDVGLIYIHDDIEGIVMTENKWLSSKLWGYTAAVALLPYALLKTIWAFGIALGWTAEGIAKLHLAMKSVNPVMYFIYSNGIDITAILACVASLLGLSLVQRWGRKVNRRFILFPAWLGGAAFTCFGAVGLYSLIESATEDMQLWVFFLVYGGFLLWGITILLAAVSFRKRETDRYR
jgi:hypothetical protein